jgi:hypothetical protein
VKTPARRLPARGALALAALAALAGSCATQGEVQPFLQSLDRPTDVAFACYGRLRITDGNPATPAQEITFAGQPMESCRIRARPSGEDVPAGQQDLDNQPSFANTHAYYAFILQSVPGTVAVARAAVKKPGQGYQNGEIAVQDATGLTPGKNSLSVGSLPIAIAGDTSGCHMVTANAGSCDLSIIDVNRAIERSSEPTVRRQGVFTPSGARVRARPAAMLASEEPRVIGRACPAEPDGLYYIAYPDCHAVAMVRADTGTVLASIRFADDGTATIGDGELACPAECGGGGTIVDGGRPVALDVIDDQAQGTIRLAIGLDNRPVVTVVDLDPSWAPIQVEQVELSGDVGLLAVAISPQIGVGGEGPDDNTNGTDQAQFVYGVATDGSVRVAEVFDTDFECDTQADPRFLVDVADASAFTCIPVGVPGAPPRRALADGPGIRIPGDAVPVSVAIGRSRLDVTRPEEPSPVQLIGTFAYVGLSSGAVAVVNIDDDNYPDVQVTAADPLRAQLALGMPHQPRDSFLNRAIRNQEMEGGNTTDVCNNAPVDGLIGGPRAYQDPVRGVRVNSVAAEKSYQLPLPRQLDCQGSDGQRPVSELTLNAPIGTRLETFPDWRAIEIEEVWTMTWEGTLSADTVNSAVDGPPVRSGYVEVAGGGIRVHDGARPFCQVGVEDRDTVVLRGCDPSRGDAQCGAGQTCYVHPDSTQAAGACLPKDQLADLAGPCREFLISSRRFAVKRAFADELELIERRRALRTTPITGCVSDQQCQQLATYEETLDSTADPIDDPMTPSTRTFACEVDPTRPAIGGQAIKRCVQACAASADCGPGGKCLANRCIEAPVPPPACVVGVQKYEIQASDAFVVLGSVTGYLHGMIEDPASGRCVKDPASNPLLAGRIPLTAPPCGGDSVASVTPNPCSIEVDQTEELPVFRAGTCELTGSTIASRRTDAIRFRNPQMTMNLVDRTYPGDERCIGDRGGDLVGVPIVYPGYQILFRQVAGFSTAAVANVRGSYLARLVRGPDRAIWVVDEGDISTSQLNLRGQVFRFSHDPFGSGLVIR